MCYQTGDHALTLPADPESVGKLGTGLSEDSTPQESIPILIHDEVGRDQSLFYRVYR